MSKESFRKIFKQRRDEVSPEFSNQCGGRLLNFLKNFSHFQNWLIYAPIQNEISTKPIFEWLKSKGSKVYFPKILGETLEFYELSKWEHLETGPLSPEPKKSANKFGSQDEGVVLVPGLGFSKSGQRVGFGKGFYDRFLSEHPQLLRIAPAYDFQVSLSPWADEAHDQLMDFVVTPSGVWGSKRIL